MKRLKLFFACLLMAVLSIGQVWATDVTYTFTSKSWADASSAWTGGGDGNGFTNGQGIQVTTGTTGANATSNSSFSNVSKVVVTYNTNKSKGAGSIAIKIGTNDEVSNSVAYSGSADGTSANFTTQFDFSPVQTGAIKITTNTTTNSIWVKSITITYSDGGTPDPIVSADPEEVEDVPVAGVTNQTIDLTYENITDYETEVSVHPNADGTGTLSPAWLTASVSDADDYATVTYSVSANEGAARTAYIKVYTTDGDKEAETIIPVSQAKYSAPTGTFELFSGDLAEGEYVICSGTTTALKNTSVAGPRIGYESVSVSESKIQNPDESLVWKIEALTGDDAGKWTIYNEAEEVYAAFNTTDGRGVLLEEVTDYAKWTTSGSYDFINVGKTSKNYLRYNNGYGFASYASGTGAALTLYKKQVAGQPKAPTFSIPEGNYESAQSVELSCETEGAKIYYTLDGSTPTSTSTEYNNTAIPVSATTTIKAIAIKNEVTSTVASATYTIVVWQTVDEIWSSITSEGPTNANVWGYVSQANVGGYNNNYYISVDGSLTANQLEIYKGNNAGNTVAVGDKVHVNGDLTIFNSIKEFKQNTGVIVHYAAKGDLQSVAVSGTPTKTEYAANEDFDPAGLVVTGTYANGYVGVITEGITWGNDLTDNKVTETTTVHVTATVSGITNSPAHNVGVIVAAKTLLSIAATPASYAIYTGEVLPEPKIMATFNEGDPEDVSTLAIYDTESAFNTAVIDNPDPQTITVSYTFGGETKTTTYTVSVQDYANADDAPYSVTEALNIITKAIGNTQSAKEIVVAGTVSEDNISNYKNRYKISDGDNELLVYNGKGFNNADFTNANYPKVGDVIVVKGNVINYQGNTPEFVTGKSYLLSQVRPATLATEAVTNFEVGSADIEVTDLTFTTASDGVITFESSNHEEYVKIVEGKLRAVAAGTATITANLAATANEGALNYSAASTTFDVTVIPAQVKYTITFDGNGATGGSAPTAIEDKAEGDNVTLPANSYKKTGKVFDGWRVFYLDANQEEQDVPVANNAFTMPAFDVTIQAQWADAPYWATVYDHITGATVAHTGSGVDNGTITISEASYNLVKAGSKNNTGTIVVTVPVGTTDLHFHAFAWGGKTAKIELTGVTNPSVSEFNLEGESGAAGEGNDFTLQGDPVDQYFHVSFDAVEAETEITFSKATGSADNRFFFYGVNQEGGALPVLESIEIKGDLTTKTGYKAGDALDLDGLTVEATYSLAGVNQTPVDITNKLGDGLTLTYDPLVENQTEVTITATYGDKSDDITITGLEAVASADPKIYVQPSLAVNFGSIEVGEAVPTAQTITINLTNVSSVTATLGGTNPEAFSISKTEGIVSGDEITISILANTDAAASYSATIAISDGAGGATDKTVNLSFAVTEPIVEDDVTGTWTLVTNATQLAAGKKVIIAQYVDADGAINTMAGQSTNNRSVIESTVAGTTLTPAVGTKVMTLADAGEGHFYLKTSDGEYLYNASTSGKSMLKTKAEEEDASWTIAADANGIATITSVENSNRTKMRYNPNTSGSPLFNCYASGQEDIALYMLEESTPDFGSYQREVTAGNYGTICLPKAGTIEGATLFEIANYENEVIYMDEIISGELEAGRPYIFQADANATEIVVNYTSADVEETAGHANGLYGFYDLENENATLPLADDASLGNYILYQNAYWLVSGRAAYIANYRAYIKLSQINNTGNQAPGRRRVAMTVNGAQNATGMENVQGDNVQCTKVLIDGQMYILRGEKLYDATGRLVK